MLLKGSCHCGAVRFSLQSRTPYPFMLCYCTICRKTAGGGGYAINIMGRCETLEVEGESDLTVYRARREDGGEHEGRRHFCSRCGSALWLADPRWPEGVWPFASAIDSTLPEPPERIHMMENYRPPWVAVKGEPNDGHFPEYSEESIRDWHQRRGLLEPE